MCDSLRSARVLGAIISLLAGAATATLIAQGGQQPSHVNPVGPDQVSVAEPIRGTSSVSVRDGQLTVTGEGLSLKAVLDAISQASGLSITQAPGMSAPRVSAHFSDVPLDEALRQLLRDYDAFFFYGGDQQSAASLKAVWIYMKGQGRIIRPVPADQWASTSDIDAMRRDTDPLTRAKAYSALLDRKRGQAPEILLDALNDPDGHVRSLVLQAAFRKGLKPPDDSLMNLALSDASPRVRFTALNALANHPQVRSIAESALNDPDEWVRNRAREILSGIGESNRPKK